MFESLATSPIVRAVGLALLHFVWQGTAIGLVAALLLRSSRRATAPTRYAIAVFALGALLLAPVATAWMFWSAGAVAPVGGVSASVSAVLGASADSVTSDGLSRVLPAVVIGWTLGVLAMTVHLSGSWLAVRRLGRSAASVTEPWQSRATEIAARLGITRLVSLSTSAHVDVPTLVGWLRPVVLMPVSVLAGLTPRQLEAVLTHELAHVRRHDYLINVLQGVVETLLFYHPAIWWVSREIRREREHCCDELVVAVCGDRVMYARALASLEELRRPVPALGLAATDGDLLERIRRVLGHGDEHARRPSVGSVLAVLLLVAPIGFFGATADATAVGADTMAAAPVMGGVKAEAAPVQTLRVGGDVPQPRKIHDEAPVYPAAARAAGIQGIVILEATIDEQGSVTDVTVLRSVPELDQAAVDAVRQWKYDPVVLDGQPRAVLMTVTVNFKLNDDEATALTPLPSGAYRIGGGITPPQKTVDVPPVYPQIARDAGVSDIVIMETTIDPGGNVTDIKILRGSPMLNQAALDAVKQWKYLPTVLNGVPVSVVMTTTVNFRLDDATATASEGTSRVAQLGATTPRASPKPLPDGTYRVGGDVTPPRKIVDASPVYPEIARAARVSDIVIMEAIIDTAGNVADVKILRGNPMLNQAAIDAVTQWKYEPVLLNGEPVSVVMTVTVNFRLDEAEQAAPPAAVAMSGPTLLRHVDPVYPEVARAARISDIVIVELTVDKEGHVADAVILRGNPLLNQAALDAVKQWRYAPVTRNGEPVSVMVTVTLRFSPDATAP